MSSTRLLTALLLLTALAAGCSDSGTGPEPVAVDRITRLAGDYVDNRYFFLDLAGVGDQPGRNLDREVIDPASVMVFVRMPDGQMTENDVAHMAAYTDRSGVWTGLDFQSPDYQAIRWRLVPFDLRLDGDGRIETLILDTGLDDGQVMGVCYDVLSPNGALLYKVGDRPGRDELSRVLLPGGVLYYRLKLLKPERAHQTAFTFDYVRRNVYDLGRRNIDPAGFDVVIRRMDADDETPALDEGLLPYIRVFGLDRYNADGRFIPDNQPDIFRQELFDLEKGLLIFPVDFRQPFNGAQERYETYANSPNFFWDGTFLREHLAPELYDHTTAPAAYAQYSYFKIDFEYAR